VESLRDRLTRPPSLMVRSPRSGRLEPSGTTVAFILRDAATRFLLDEVDMDMRPRSRGMTCPSFGRGSPRKEGAGNAGCALHPRSRVQWVEGKAHEHTGSAEALRHSLRNGFTAYTCSSRRRIPLASVASGLRFVLSPVGPTRLRRLDISHGCQNHTTSPYAAPSLHSDRRDAGPKFWRRP
jgi:hypothetical protein